jgi:hypothetical protein
MLETCIQVASRLLFIMRLYKDLRRGDFSDIGQLSLSVASPFEMNLQIAIRVMSSEPSWGFSQALVRGNTRLQ